MRDKIIKALKEEHPGQENLVEAVFAQAETGLKTAVDTARTEASANKEALQAAEATIETLKNEKAAALASMENMQKSMAEQLKAAAFAASAIPEDLQEDLKTTLDPEAFMENGILKEVEWKAHLDAKFAAWNKAFGSGEETVQGFGSSSKDAKAQGHGGKGEAAEGYSDTEIKARLGIKE